MKTIRTRIAVAAVAIGMTAGFAGAAYADDAPGVTKDSIKIGLFAPISGPNKAYGFDPLNAAKMWYDKINAEGGVNGRKIDYVVEDTRCNANDLVAAVKKLVEQDHVFILNGGSCSSATVAAKDYVVRNNIPMVMLNASGDGALYPPVKQIYGAFSISQHAVGGSVVEFSVQHFKARKIGYINHDDAYGSWNIEAAKYMAKKDGATLDVQSVSPTISDVTAPMLKIKAANPDALVLTTYARPAALIVKKAHELGFNKPIILAVTGTANLGQMAENVGGKAALQNFYTQEVLAGAPGSEKLQWVYDMYKKAYPKLAAQPDYPQPYMPYGLPPAMAVVRALKEAGQNPTRDKFLDALSHMKFDSKVMAGPIEFSPQDHAAQESTIYLKFDGKTSTLIPGVYTNAWHYGDK